MNTAPDTTSTSTEVAVAPTARGILESHHVPVVPSADLLRGQKAVVIEHNGSLYRLHTTRQGKLILTK